MTYWPVKPGAPSPWRNLGQMFRDISEADRAEYDAELKRRELTGAPAGDDDLPEPTEVAQDEAYDEVHVRFAPLTNGDVDGMRVRLMQASEAVGEAEGRAVVLAAEGLREVYRHIVSCGVAELSIPDADLEHVVGLDAEIVRWLERAELLEALAVATLRYFRLGRDARGNYGGPQPSISGVPSTTAADAHPSSAQPKAATAGPRPHTLPAHRTSRAYAQGGTSSTHPGSATLLHSTDESESSAA